MVSPCSRPPHPPALGTGLSRASVLGYGPEFKGQRAPFPPSIGALEDRILRNPALSSLLAASASLPQNPHLDAGRTLLRPAAADLLLARSANAAISLQHQQRLARSHDLARQIALLEQAEAVVKAEVAFRSRQNLAATRSALAGLRPPPSVAAALATTRLPQRQALVSPGLVRLLAGTVRLGPAAATAPREAVPTPKLPIPSCPPRYQPPPNQEGVNAALLLAAARGPSGVRRPQDSKARQPPTNRVWVHANDLREVDILCERGGKSNRWPGNKRYRQVVMDLRHNYRSTLRKSDKTALSKAIYNFVGEYGGRFLKRQKDPDTGMYYEMTVDECRVKIAQALRETKDLKWIA